MASPARRIGAENSATRALILDAAESVIREEGYASASTRRVAARAGFKPSLVHYYFPTTDDLLLELSKRGAQASDRMIEAALASDYPLHALWAFFSDTSRTAISLEFMALANHRESIRAHMAEHSEDMRKRQVDALTRLIRERLSGGEDYSPAALSLIMAGVGRALIMEGGLGVDAGHEEARALVEQWLDRLEPMKDELAKS
jgi:AcrR family transcriptional regulator